MRAEIITVGSELLMGQTLDTHSQYLSQELVSLGIDVCYHSSVEDQIDHLREAIESAHSRSDIVFLCGGLGPTKDDLTKEVVADFLNIPLVLNRSLLSDLEKYFAEQSRPMPDNNRKQAFVFSNGKVFPNPNGTACGLAITKDDVTYVLLPGPPRELIPMFQTSVQPFLLQKLAGSNVIISQPLSFFGIGESTLAEKVDDLITRTKNPIIATYIQDLEVTLRITAQASSQKEAEQLIAPIKREILNRVGSYCYSEQGQSLEKVVCQQLRQEQKTIAFAESCTGGLLTHLLTTVPGSSAVLKGGWVCYTNDVKTRLLHLPTSYLQEEGAVSRSTAEWLAEETRKQFASDYAISVTGVAGPGQIENQPVGQVYIGLAQYGKRPQAISYSFQGTRKRVQKLAAKHALFLLQQQLKKGESTT